VSQANFAHGKAAPRDDGTYCARVITADLDQLLVHGLDTAQTWCLQEFDLWLGQQIKRDHGYESVT
jgi:hypothetical protein